MAVEWALESSSFVFFSFFEMWKSIWRFYNWVGQRERAVQPCFPFRGGHSSRLDWEIIRFRSSNQVPFYLALLSSHIY
jgi:hypothetical protein